MVYMSCDDVTVDDFAVDLDELSKRLKLNRAGMKVDKLHSEAESKPSYSYKREGGKYEIYLSGKHAGDSKLEVPSSEVSPYAINQLLGRKKPILDLFSERTKNSLTHCDADAQSDSRGKIILDLYTERLQRRQK